MFKKLTSANSSATTTDGFRSFRIVRVCRREAVAHTARHGGVSRRRQGKTSSREPTFPSRLFCSPGIDDIAVHRPPSRLPVDE